MAKRKEGYLKGEHWTQMIRSTMETAAWQALPPTAQALYPWIKLEWHGNRANNNGEIRLSVRQAAERLGVSKDTAAKAFQELQAKGFLVVREAACLGVSGEGKSPAFEITELAMPHAEGGRPRKLFLQWRPDKQFAVRKAIKHNPSGRNRKRQNPVIELVTRRPKF